MMLAVLHDELVIVILFLLFPAPEDFPDFALQIEFRRAAKALKIPALMAHSTDGSGWVRQGLAAENPIHTNEPFLFYAFEDSRSVYALIYEWVLQRGYMLLPERVETPARSDIEFDIIETLLEENKKRDDIFKRLVPQDDLVTNFLKRNQ